MPYVTRQRYEIDIIKKEIGKDKAMAKNFAPHHTSGEAPLRVRHGDTNQMSLVLSHLCSTDCYTGTYPRSVIHSSSREYPSLQKTTPSGLVAICKPVVQKSSREVSTQPTRFSGSQAHSHRGPRCPKDTKHASADEMKWQT